MHNVHPYVHVGFQLENEKKQKKHRKPKVFVALKKFLCILVNFFALWYFYIPWLPLTVETMFNY